MQRETFEILVADAVTSLPRRALDAMKNVDIVIEQMPRHTRSREAGIKRGEVLLGLYEGIPLINRDSGYFGALPDKITIFQQPIEAFADGDPEKMAELVREVVWHEIGHHFGLNDAELRALEKERKRKMRGD